MKTNIIRVILIVLLLMTFSIIFGFSSQDGEESKGLSRKITELITQNNEKIQSLDKQEKEKVLNRIEAIIRKIAHFSIYTVIGILLMALMCMFNIIDKVRVGVTFILGIIYAATDEFHQVFVQGRTALITDVVIDTMGVILGILLVLLIREIYRKCKKGKTEQNPRKYLISYGKCVLIDDKIQKKLTKTAKTIEI